MNREEYIEAIKRYLSSLNLTHLKILYQMILHFIR